LVKRHFFRISLTFLVILLCVTNCTADVGAFAIIQLKGREQNGFSPAPNEAPIILTLENNRQTMILHKGENIELILGNSYFWVVFIDQPEVVSRIWNVLIPDNSQGIYASPAIGNASLTAVGTPTCDPGFSDCNQPPVYYVFHVKVIP